MKKRRDLFLRELNAIDGLDALLSSSEKSPLEYLKNPGQEKKPQRFRAKAKNGDAPAAAFKWGDED